mgnify:CR=1 FL=1
MMFFNMRCAGEVGNGLSHFDESVVAAGTEAKEVKSLTQYLSSRLAQAARLLDFPVPHVGSCKNQVIVGQPRRLPLPGRAGLGPRIVADVSAAWLATKSP